uniref:SFRICE_003093 n=1 Tax=Spodoptera frugiperda TaxID=7108 RepID=A0A2H1V0Y2_SPOFR
MVLKLSTNLIHTYITSRLSTMRDIGPPIATNLTHLFHFINSHQSFLACLSVKVSCSRHDENIVEENNDEITLNVAVGSRLGEEYLGPRLDNKNLEEI